MHIIGNYKNVPMSSAVRHQHDVAARLFALKNAAEVQLGPGQLVMIEQLKNGSLIDEALGGNSLLLQFYHCNWAEIRGTMYKTGCYLVASLDKNCSMPVFVCVHNILARNQGEDVLYFCEKLFTTSFDNHFHAWSLQWFEPKQYICCNPKTLKYFIPHSLHSVTVEQHFVTLRHKV